MPAPENGNRYAEQSEYSRVCGSKHTFSENRLISLVRGSTTLLSPEAMIYLFSYAASKSRARQTTRTATTDLLSCVSFHNQARSGNPLFYSSRNHQNQSM